VQLTTSKTKVNVVHAGLSLPLQHLKELCSSKQENLRAILNNNLSTVLKMVTKDVTEDLWTTLSNGGNKLAMKLITRETTHTQLKMDHANKPDTLLPPLKPQVITT